MSAFLACALALAPQPIFRLGPDAVLSVAGARLLPGTAIVNSSRGVALDFDGDHCGIELPDAPVFQLAGSVSISCWLNLRSYVTPQSSAGGSQVLFRGDDRSGLDPYHLTVLRDGAIAFAIESEEGGLAAVAPIDLRRWTHVVGSFDAKTGALRLYIDGRLAAFNTTRMKPLLRLDASALPGVGIGNIQAASGGAHNQPLNGQICDLRLYDVSVTPDQIGYGQVSFRE